MDFVKLIFHNKSKILIALMMGILVLGILARIFSWSDFLFYDDSYAYALGGKFFAESLNFSGNMGAMGSSFLFPIYKSGYAIFSSLFTGIGIDPILAGKIISLGSSLLSTYLFYLLGKKLLEKKQNLLSLALFGISFVAVAVSTLVLSESLAVVLILAVILLILSGRFLPVLGGIIYFLAILTRPELALLLPAFLFLSWRNKNLIWFGSGLGVSVIAGITFAYFAGIDLSLIWKSALELLQGNFALKFTGIKTLLFFDYIIFVLGIFGWFLLKNKSLKIFLALWILPLFLVYLPRDQFRFYALIIPALALTSGIGVWKIWGKIISFKKKWLIWVSVVASIILFGLQVFYIFRPWHPAVSYERAETLELQSALNKNSLPKEYVLASIAPEPIFLETGSSVLRIEAKNLRGSIEKFPEKIALVWDQALLTQLPDLAQKIDLAMAGNTFTFFRVDIPYYYKGDKINPQSPVKIYLMTKEQLLALIATNQLT